VTADTADLVAQLDRSACRSCHTPVMWAGTQDGNRLIINAQADDVGNVTIEPDLFDHPVAIVHGDVAPGRWTPHWATCPDADSWRTR
jgi:hypothetical protein